MEILHGKGASARFPNPSNREMIVFMSQSKDEKEFPFQDLLSIFLAQEEKKKLSSKCDAMINEALWAISKTDNFLVKLRE